MIIIGFSMSSTLLNFQEKYYEYGEEGLETKGSEIGGYESAFLADLVASYLFEVTNNQFREFLWRVIYRDYGLLVFKGRISIPDIRIWRDKLQEKIDKIAGNDYYNSLVKLGTRVDAFIY